MSDQGIPVYSPGVFEQLSGMSGQPVRVTILDPASRERIVRIPGTLNQTSRDEVQVTLLNLPSDLPNQAPVTLEILVNSQLYWTHTYLRRVCSARSVALALPEQLQSQSKRQHPRVDLDVPVRLVTKGGSRYMQGRLRDLSAGGASVLLSEPLEPGDRAVLVFALGSGMFFKDLELEVVRVTRVPDTGCVTAFRFWCDSRQEQEIAKWVERQLSR